MQRSSAITGCQMAAPRSVAAAAARSASIRRSPSAGVPEAPTSAATPSLGGSLGEPTPGRCSEIRHNATAHFHPAQPSCMLTRPSGPRPQPPPQVEHAGAARAVCAAVMGRAPPAHAPSCTTTQRISRPQHAGAALPRGASCVLWHRPHRQNLSSSHAVPVAFAAMRTTDCARTTRAASSLHRAIQCLGWLIAPSRP